MSFRASGLGAWVIQRATAVYLALFGLYVMFHLVLAPPADYATWRAWITQPWVQLGWLLFVPGLLAHAWVGIRDIAIDYVHALGLRIAVLGVFAATLIASGLWALKALMLAGIE